MRGLPVSIVGAVFGALAVAIFFLGAGTDAGVSPSSSDRLSASADLERRMAPDVPNRTLGDLSEIEDPQARRAAALALLQSLGGDSAAIDSVAAALPPVESVNFRIHAILDMAVSDPTGALAVAKALPEREQRRQALLRLAPRLAESDPLGAMAAIDGFGESGLENEFLAALFDAWAVHDPSAMLLFLESDGDSAVAATDAAFEALAASDPERLLALGDALRRDLAARVTEAALGSMIEGDAAGVLDRLASLSRGGDWTILKVAAAQAYGAQDPEAAWAWARLNGADALTTVSVVGGIHERDPDLAWDYLQSVLNGPDAQLRAGLMQPYLMNYVNAVVSSKSAEDVVIGLDRLLSLNDPGVDSLMQTNIQAWASREPESALDWSLQHLDRINAAGVLSSLGAGLARTNIDLARQTIYRLDEAHQANWAGGVGRTLAETDLQAARNWAYELPSGALRDAGLQPIVRAEAERGSIDPLLLGQFSSDSSRSQAASTAARLFTCAGNTDLALEVARSYISNPGRLEETTRLIEGGDWIPGTMNCQLFR